MTTDKRKIQEINAGSMADIAFLLLIFFLVATTMNVDTGIVRILPPMPPEDQKQEEIKVKERNLLLVFLDGSGGVGAGITGEIKPIHVNSLKDIVKEFILNPTESESYPEKKDKEIELPDGSTWIYPVSSGVVSLQTTRATDYQAYIDAQNELTRAFNELRNELSTSRFNKNFEDLQKAERDAITSAIPLAISEAEPRNIKK